MEEIERLFKRLPDDLKKEVIDYMEFLLERGSQTKEKELKFTWRGGLRELKDEYSSVDLQHKRKWWN
ncbi:MAG: DUF2281 domain-containing protein [Halobacteriota archaeon]